ncbi:MAG: hypothetical protein HZB67_01650 [Candidatus Aenigmarchaeota archaeon]|nr:hypothetical protein [Candidatus Aenigmarchaeota archaeon]
MLKHWNDDPEEEGGFLEWMRFDAAKDNLDLFQDNLKKSEWIQKIQRNRGLKFEEMWNEMISRGETKNYLVELKNKYSVPRLLEADYSVRAHNKYALMEEKQREEHGSVNHKELLKEWRKWVEESLVRELVAEKPSKGK